jgi:prepilin-type N-terminal cleavage/methylation domain-containing protein
MIARPVRKNGFTLMEIIVATTIMGIALVAVLQLFSIGLSSGRRSQRATIAVSLARNVMEEILSRDELTNGTEGGRFEEEGMDYAIEIQPGEFEELHEVLVTVSWSERGGTKDYRLFCYVPDESSGLSVFPE